MVSSRSAWLCLTVFLAAASAGCRPAAEEPPLAHRGDVAVPSYTADPGTPPYCARLAASTALPAVPAAVGLLAADPGSVEADLDLTAAIDELRELLDDAPAEARSPLDDAVDDLVAALAVARDRGLTDAVRDDIGAGLDELGTLVQPACGFPT